MLAGGGAGRAWSRPGLGMVAHPMLLALLAVPPFIGGLRCGVRGVALALSRRAGRAAGARWSSAALQLDDELATDAVTWLLTGRRPRH